MSAWREVFKDKLRSKFILDRDGYIKYPANIDEILDIIELEIRKETAPITARKQHESSLPIQASKEEINKRRAES